MIWLCLAIALAPPVQVTDVLELNHYFGTNGRHVFNQWIWWDWNCYTERFEVVDWRFAKKDHVLLFRVSHFELQLEDHDGKWRVVYSRQFRETWTDWDPEVLDRKHTPVDERIGLRKRVRR